MNQPAPHPSLTNHSALRRFLFLLIALTVLFHVGMALKGHGLHRDQHIGAALHYAATRFDLQHTIIAGFNATQTPTVQEVPVWQMAAGLAFKCLGGWWGWANVVSLALFLNCLYPLFQVVRQFYGERTAWWALIFFLAQGLIFRFAGEAGTDGFCLSVTIWFWFACGRLIQEPGKWFVPAALLGTLTAVSKLPFFMAAGLGSFFLVWHAHGLRWKSLAPLAGVGAVSAGVFLGWTHYTDHLQENALFPYVDLRLSAPPANGSSMMFWYFGDWHYRLSPFNWIRAAWRFCGDSFGSFALALLFLYGAGSPKTHPAAKFFWLGSFLTTLVFSHLILHHHHYLMLYCPATAVLCAAALGGIEQFLAERGARGRWFVPAACTALFLCLFQGITSLRLLTVDTFPDLVVEDIRAHTGPADKLIVINGGWGGEELLKTGLSGLSIWSADVFADPAKFAQLKALGFTKLVMISQSPYQNAIQIINPGQTAMRRQLASDYLTPQVNQWTTELANDRVIIKDIP